MMPPRTHDGRYTATAIVLHWLLAILITAMLLLGWYMLGIRRTPSGPWYVGLHKSIGTVVLVLAALRLAWRIAHRPAPLPRTLPPWQRRAAALVQWLLYACMLLMPASGFLGASFSKKGVVVFGWHLPALVAPDPVMVDRMFALHYVLAWTLAALASLHVLAGLKHLAARDGVFRRIWLR